MSNKVQKIKKELEKRIESMNSCPFKTAELGSEKFDKGELYAYKQILQFIDSLDSLPEEHNEGLEEEIKCYIKKEFPDGIGFPNVPKIARHFAEWQKQKDLQDFLEKAERAFLALYNSPLEKFERFKNYLKNEM